MSKRILVPVDGSEPSETALEFAIEEFPASDITALHVLDLPTGLVGPDTSAEPLLKAQAGTGEQILADATEHAGNYDREIETETLEGKPSTMIANYAENGEFDHIVMGSHGRSGFPRILLGSVAENVTRRAPVPVTVVR